MNAPKTILRFLAASSFLLLATPSLRARVGETADQCNTRYGDATFVHQEGDKEYRSYNFNGKRVQVVFYKSHSALEIIIIGPQQILGERQATGFTTDSVTFFRGLLSEAYRFTEAQIQELAPMTRTAMHEARSSRATNGDLRAFYWIATSERQDTIKFHCAIIKVLADAPVESLTDFYAKSGKREVKQQEQAKAKGF